MPSVEGSTVLRYIGDSILSIHETLANLSGRLDDNLHPAPIQAIQWRSNGDPTSQAAIQICALQCNSDTFFPTIFPWLMSATTLAYLLLTAQALP